jgi:hypothetical protein
MVNKRFGFVLLIAILVLGGAFAQPAFRLSVGGGGFAEYDAIGGGYEVSSGSQSTKVNVYMPGLIGGVFAFFDVTYAELSIGFAGGIGGIVPDTDADAPNLSITNFNISLLGKYPFMVTEKLSVFPLLGIDYKIMLSVKDNDGNEADSPGDFNALYFKFGGGLDYSFTEQIYLRFSALYGIRLPNQFETDMINRAKDQNLSANALLGQGLTAKIAVGYKF